MSRSDGISLPRDPGPVPAALREAFVRATANEFDALQFPQESHIELLALGEGDDDVRLSTIDQLLITAEGSVLVAHLVAARGATIGSESQIQSLTGSYPTPSADAALGHSLSTHLPETRRERSTEFTPVFIAATLLLVAGASWLVVSQQRAGDESRASRADLQLLAVPETAPGTPVTLRWTPLRAETRYSVEVLDADDASVFQIDTRETRSIVPAASLAPGIYRWSVRARIVDQGEVRSRVGSFVVR